MVIIGHSMGGLLARIMVQDGGSGLEKIIFKKSIKDLDVKPETKELLTESLMFKHLPFVKRVVFMATPHRGSEMTHWTIMKMAVKFITLPFDIVDTLDDIGKSPDIRDEIIKDAPLKNLHGVDALDPENKVMRYMLDVPIHAKYHSVIGNAEKAGEIGGTDGIVTYRSAHLDGAESEVIIKSGHNVQKEPAGIKEVRRILLELLKEGKQEREGRGAGEK